MSEHKCKNTGQVEVTYRFCCCDTSRITVTLRTGGRCSFGTNTYLCWDEATLWIENDTPGIDHRGASSCELHAQELVAWVSGR